MTDLEVLQSSQIEKTISVLFLQKNGGIIAPIGSADGDFISLNFSKDANSDLRTNVDLSMVVRDSDNAKDIKRVADEGWINVFVDVIVTYTVSDGAHNYKIGRFIVNAPQSSYSAEEDTLSLSCVDLMAQLTGMRGGVVDYERGSTIRIPKGENVRKSMITVLKRFGIIDYDLDECLNSNGEIQPVPYDLEFETGTTGYDMLTALRDVMPNYAIYFDNNGIFCYKPIPTDETVPVVLPYVDLGKLVISEQVSVDYESIKNHVQVYGKSHDCAIFLPPDYNVSPGNSFTSGWTMWKRGRTYNDIYTPTKNLLDCSIAFQGDLYLPDQFLVGLQFPREFRDINNELFDAGSPSLIQDERGFSISITLHNSNTAVQSSGYLYEVGADYVGLGDLSDVPKVTTLSSTDTGTSTGNLLYYVFLVRTDEFLGTHWFVNYGQQQVFAESKNEAPQSAFSIDKIGEKTIVLTGGDYENIPSDTLAQERADIELYWRSNMQESITLETIPIPWLDVDTIITYSKKQESTPIKYIVKSISCDYTAGGATMSINAAKFYPLSNSSFSGLLNLVYPVGSIYMSVNSASPADLFGGTWEQIQGRFLLGASNSYAAGSVGGEASHTLTIDNLPPQDSIAQVNQTGSSVAGNTIGTVAAGNWGMYVKQDVQTGQTALDNMPPYLSVYVWKRTA